jgi:hypothetical protein
MRTHTRAHARAHTHTCTQTHKHTHARARTRTQTHALKHTHTHAARRSPTAYEANPARERALYKHDTEKTMTLLRVSEAGGEGRGRGMLSWFAVHPVSMNNTNPYLR